ncbi:MAG: hypothetical protein AAGH40_04515 [Verrucomicrobiota bacterium]
MKKHGFFENHLLEHGKLWVDGKHKFLKTGKPLRNFGKAEDCEALIKDLPIIQSKGYSNLALNCYWHHFNPSGNGLIEVSVEPLKKLIAAIQEHGMYASLSVETYGVGGGQIPEGFWEKNPDALAVNHLGELVSDTEYGYGSKVPSLFSEAYLDASRAYMTNLVAALGAENFLYFETTVEPQFMGAQWLDYSEAAKAAYTHWLKDNADEDSLTFPESFPASDTFRQSKAWNTFRAQALADWINGDASALRKGSTRPSELWVASDYLDAEDYTLQQRCGDPVELLRKMTEIDIIQVNWAWCNIDRKPNQKAYDRVKKVIQETGRDWVVTEHMTINGADYFETDMPGLLENTLANGTHFGWEFVDIAADLDSPETKPNDVLPGDFKPQHFSVYDAEWNPKPAMRAVEDDWDKWLELATAKNSPSS